MRSQSSRNQESTKLHIHISWFGYVTLGNHHPTQAESLCTSTRLHVQPGEILVNASQKLVKMVDNRPGQEVMPQRVCTTTSGVSGQKRSFFLGYFVVLTERPGLYLYRTVHPSWRNPCSCPFFDLFVQSDESRRTLYIEKPSPSSVSSHLRQRGRRYIAPLYGLIQNAWA